MEAICVPPVLVETGELCVCHPALLKQDSCKCVCVSPSLVKTGELCVCVSHPALLKQRSFV